MDGAEGKGDQLENVHVRMLIRKGGGGCSRAASVAVSGYASTPTSHPFSFGLTLAQSPAPYKGH